MYTSLTWVPRGVACAKLEQAPPAAPMEDESNVDVATENEGDQELDMADVLANDLDSLSFYKSNKDDPLLAHTEAKHSVYDDDELDEMRIRPTDALLVAAKSGEEASQLEFHLLDDNPEDSDDDEPEEYHPNTYVHHDMLLPAIPLCAAYSTVQMDAAKHNLVAVAMFTPGIDVWDVDAVNAMTPVQTLGGFDLEAGLKTRAAGAAKKKRSSSKKPRLPLKDGSHTEAVLSLSWNQVQREYLASASADHTVKVWDVESAHCACTMSHHNDKVQSVAFHPQQESTLLTGSFDKTVHVLDVRSQQSTGSWQVDSDVESCHWLPCGPGTHKVLVATELGTLYLFDPRNLSDTAQPIAKWPAHNGPTSALNVSPDIPGMFVSGGIDKRVKMWSLDGAAPLPKLLIDIPSKVGAVFSAALCPASTAAGSAGMLSPFVLAYGGQTGNVEVVDLGVDHKTLRCHYKTRIGGAAFGAMEKRAARGSNAPRVLEKLGHAEGEECEDCGPVQDKM